jgi:hypothetical protein
MKRKFSIVLMSSIVAFAGARPVCATLQDLKNNLSVLISNLKEKPDFNRLLLMDKSFARLFALIFGVAHAPLGQEPDLIFNLMAAFTDLETSANPFVASVDKVLKDNLSAEQRGAYLNFTLDLLHLPPDDPARDQVIQQYREEIGLTFSHPASVPFQEIRNIVSENIFDLRERDFHEKFGNGAFLLSATGEEIPKLKEEFIKFQSRFRRETLSTSDAYRSIFRILECSNETKSGIKTWFAVSLARLNPVQLIYLFGNKDEIPNSKAKFDYQLMIDYLRRRLMSRGISELDFVTEMIKSEHKNAPFVGMHFSQLFKDSKILTYTLPVSAHVAATSRTGAPRPDLLPPHADPRFVPATSRAGKAPTRVDSLKSNRIQLHFAVPDELPATLIWDEAKDPEAIEKSVIVKLLEPGERTEDYELFLGDLPVKKDVLKFLASSREYPLRFEARPKRPVELVVLYHNGRDVVDERRTSLTLYADSTVGDLLRTFCEKSRLNPEEHFFSCGTGAPDAKVSPETKISALDLASDDIFPCVCRTEFTPAPAPAPAPPPPERLPSAPAPGPASTRNWGRPLGAHVPGPTSAQPVSFFVWIYLEERKLVFPRPTVVEPDMKVSEFFDEIIEECKHKRGLESVGNNPNLELIRISDEELSDLSISGKISDIPGLGYIRGVRLLLRDRKFHGEPVPGWRTPTR